MPRIKVFDDGLEGYIGVWDRSIKKESTARDSIAGSSSEPADVQVAEHGTFPPIR